MAQNTNSLEFNVLPWKTNGLEVHSILSALSRNKSPDTQDFVSIHNTMSDLSPGAALLYAARSMMEVAKSDFLLSFDPKFLKGECSKIIKAYKDESKGSYDLLQDLEDFHSLLDLCYLSYEMDYPLVSEIIDILRKQISAQIVIMDEVLDMKASAQDQGFVNNIIPFPGCSVEV